MVDIAVPQFEQRCMKGLCACSPEAKAKDSEWAISGVLYLFERVYELEEPYRDVFHHCADVGSKTAESACN